MSGTASSDGHDVFVEATTSSHKSDSDEDNCDVTLEVGGYQCRANKEILASGSMYFHDLFNSTEARNSHQVVNLKNMDFECVKICVDFIYTGKYDAPIKKIENLMKAVTFIRMEKFKTAISDDLGGSLNVKNFLSTREIAEKFDLRDLKAKCKRFEEAYIVKVLHQSDIESKSKSYVTKVLTTKKMSFSEQTKLAIIITWTGEDVKKKDDFVDLLKLIKLSEVSKKYLRKVIKHNQIICTDFTLYNMMSWPLAKHLDEAKRKELLLMIDKNRNQMTVTHPDNDVRAKLPFITAGLLNVIQPRRFSAISMDPFIYILCEDSTVFQVNYKAKHVTIEEVTSMIDYHGSRPPVVTLCGFLYVIGNGHSTKSSDSSGIVERFDPTKCKWIKLNEYYQPVCNPTLLSHEKSIYCIGGRRKSGPTTSFGKFTPSTSQWVQLQSMKSPREACGAAVVNKTILVLGGAYGKDVDVVECYDVVSSQWSTLKNVQSIQISTFVIGHHIGGWMYVGKSENSSVYLPKYGSIDKQWQRMPTSGIPKFKIYEIVYSAEN